MNRFDLNCDNDWTNSKACSDKILKQMKLADKLKNIDEFDTMMMWRREETKTGINSYPDLSVNGIRHNEALTPISTFEMICSSLMDGKNICSGKKPSPRGNRAGIIVGTSLTIGVLIGLGIVCYRKVIRQEITNDMSSRVNELVAKYASKVSEQKKKRKDKLMERMTE